MDTTEYATSRMATYFENAFMAPLFEPPEIKLQRQTLAAQMLAEITDWLAAGQCADALNTLLGYAITDLMLRDERFHATLLRCMLSAETVTVALPQYLGILHRDTAAVLPDILPTVFAQPGVHMIPLDVLVDSVIASQLDEEFTSVAYFTFLPYCIHCCKELTPAQAQWIIDRRYCAASYIMPLVVGINARLMQEKLSVSQHTLLKETLLGVRIGRTEVEKTIRVFVTSNDRFKHNLHKNARAVLSSLLQVI